jgi:hypothetical protein
MELAQDLYGASSAEHFGLAASDLTASLLSL